MDTVRCKMFCIIRWWSKYRSHPDQVMKCMNTAAILSFTTGLQGKYLSRWVRNRNILWLLQQVVTFGVSRDKSRFFKNRAMNRNFCFFATDGNIFDSNLVPSTSFDYITCTTTKSPYLLQDCRNFWHFHLWWCRDFCLFYRDKYLPLLHYEDISKQPCYLHGTMES